MQSQGSYLHSHGHIFQRCQCWREIYIEITLIKEREGYENLERKKTRQNS